jgi:hypothetical protein
MRLTTTTWPGSQGFGPNLPDRDYHNGCVQEFVAELEAIWQPSQDREPLFKAAHLGAVEDLSGLAEDADGDAFAVKVEPDVEHSHLHKSGPHHLFPRHPLTAACFIVPHLRAPQFRQSATV